MKAFGPGKLLFVLLVLFGAQGNFGLLPRTSVQQQCTHEIRLTPSSESLIIKLSTLIKWMVFVSIVLKSTIY